MKYFSGKASIVFLTTVLSISLFWTAGKTFGANRGVTDKAYLELREWGKSGDLEQARKAKARLQGFLDAYDRIRGE